MLIGSELRQAAFAGDHERMLLGDPAQIPLIGDFDELESFIEVIEAQQQPRVRVGNRAQGLVERLAHRDSIPASGFRRNEGRIDQWRQIGMAEDFLAQC